MCVINSIMSEFESPWNVACQCPLSMEFFRQENWIGLPFPSPGDLPKPRTEPWFPASLADPLHSKVPGHPTER